MFDSLKVYFIKKEKCVSFFLAWEYNVCIWSVEVVFRNTSNKDDQITPLVWIKWGVVSLNFNWNEMQT